MYSIVWDLFFFVKYSSMQKIKTCPTLFETVTNTYSVGVNKAPRYDNYLLRSVLLFVCDMTLSFL